jgi:hypothetical protein
MRRTIKLLMVAVLVAVILVASVSPAMARRVPGGVLLPLERPCSQVENVPGAAGEHLDLNPEGRAPGCWVLLPT